ncbi:hypothetical protein DPMN_118219 [Dreissena polymorpha]|uniref:Uncharacterized protein n=1 Tax=Dreissena polymorpha TaxID=45954 RepID=A0A9D4GH30_DREPO|nr:hypothetical protein DPMN_118219 [Dreissena polymorpha]
MPSFVSTVLSFVIEIISMDDLCQLHQVTYIGVSVGGFISLIAFIVAATIIYKRRNCTKKDSINERTHTCGKSDNSNESRYVNVTNIYTEINEAHLDGPREFNDNANRIDYASDCYSG